MADPDAPDAPDGSAGKDAPQTLRPTWPTPVRAGPVTITPSTASMPNAAIDNRHAHDDLVGFTSPASLAGSSRPNDPRAARAAAFWPPEPAPPLSTDIAPGLVDIEPDLFAERPVRPVPSQTAPATDYAAARPSTDAAPFQASEASGRPSTAYFGRADQVGGGRNGAARPEAGMSLYTVYALILFAVPTLGVSALIGLAAIYGRVRSADPLALSHQAFQARTLWTAAIAAVVGALMIAVNLGVFVLFFVAVWVLLRGTFGLLRLAAGQPIAKPAGGGCNQQEGRMTDDGLNGHSENGKVAAMIAWGLYILSIPSANILVLVGLAVAYAGRGSATGVARQHIDTQIALFWSVFWWTIGLWIVVAVGAVLSTILIGIPILLLALLLLFLLHVWFTIKAILGLINLLGNRPA